MKRLSRFNRFVFILNIVSAVLLVLACTVPYIPAATFPYLSPLGLTVPLMVIIHLLFVVYWAIGRKRQVLLSVSLLVLGYFLMGPFIKLGFAEDTIEDEDLSIMSYNVRSFNKWKYINQPDIYERTFDFIAQENPDVICFQEVDYLKREEFKQYPYQHLRYVNGNNRVVLGIFSKYPIVNEGIFNWPNSFNNGGFADIVYKNDTVRIYNLHMESLNLIPETDSLVNKPFENVYRRMTRAFAKQSKQANFFLKHSEAVNYKKIVCGDFNNNQFSNSYRLVKGDLQDTFEEKGYGFGRTYNFLGIPLRIDFILADQAFDVRAHKNYDIRFSDHYPVMASFRLKEE